MVNAVNPINMNSNLRFVASFYRQTQNYAQNLASVVYKSVSRLTELSSNTSEITQESLSSLKTYLEDLNLSDTEGYRLITTMSTNFEMLSNNSDSITEDNFVSIVKFSFADSFAKNINLREFVQNGELKISEEVVSSYGMQYAQTLAFIDFISKLAEESESSSGKNDDTVFSEKIINTDKNLITDYTSITQEQLVSPINITV